MVWCLYGIKEEMATEEDFHEDVAETKPPIGLIWFVVIGACLCALLGLFWLATRLSVDIEKDCRFRGGEWDKDRKECLFEDILGGRGRQGVLMSRIVLPVSESEQGIFEQVTLGVPKEYTYRFSDGSGAVILYARLGKMHSDTRRVVVPYVRATNGGYATHLGLFVERNGEYILVDSALVGGTIGLEAVTFEDQNNSLRVKFTYRDRRKGESGDAVPRDSEMFVVSITQENTFKDAVVISREGIQFNEMLTVVTPRYEDSISSLLSITGFVDPKWASDVRIRLTDQSGAIIAEQPLVVRNTKENRAPFAVTIQYANRVDVTQGSLMFVHADLEHTVAIPLMFSLRE